MDIPDNLTSTTSSHSYTNSQSLSQPEERDYPRTQDLLGERDRLTRKLHELPYDLLLYIERAVRHADLGYPDLAAGDAYKALLLTDEVREEAGEYHDVAVEALRDRLAADDFAGVVGGRDLLSLRDREAEEDAERRGDGENGNGNGIVGAVSEEQEGQEILARLAARASIRCYQILSISLLLCGCLKSAFEFCTRGLSVAPNDSELLHARGYIQKLARRKLKLPNDTVEFDINDLPDQGLVRREIYPWNSHEPDRPAQETIDFLNRELEAVAPKCEVRATQLPTLLEFAPAPGRGESAATNIQLGLFAKDDIYAGEVVLNEFSILTANNRLKASLCDACSSQLPPLDAPESERAIPCLDCDDTLFCSRNCYDQAMSGYHPAVCEKDMDTIAKDPDPMETPNALYLLLLARSFAMAATQEVHPLELKEVKYIWGDFLPTSHNDIPLSPTAGPPPIWTLPFSFPSNISGPLHVLEKMDLDIFDAGTKDFDLWVVNTLYSKFRGTASAKVSPKDGRPEVAAVHALWCLANHDCAPNVGWEWGGWMRFFARDFPGAKLDQVGPEAAYRNQSDDRTAARTGKPDREVGSEAKGWRKGERANDESEREERQKKVVIPRDTEILSHYCDIELPVQERREWAKGSLGGWCMCERCRRESATEAEAVQSDASNDVASPVDGLELGKDGEEACGTAEEGRAREDGMIVETQNEEGLMEQRLRN